MKFKGKTHISIDSSQFSAMMSQIEGLQPQVSQYVRRNAMPQVVRLVETHMRATAPVSKPKDTQRQSKKHKQRWAKAPKLKNAIIGLLRDYGVNEFTAFVGVEHPFGNKAYFDYHGKKDRSVFAWGKDMQRTKKKVRWMVRVMDNVGPTAVKMIEKAVDDAVKKHMQGKP